MIDDFSMDTPIAVGRFDGHMLLANSLALKGNISEIIITAEL